MNLIQINQLPEDIVGEIFSFLPLKSLSLTNKFYWKKNYKIKSSSEIIKLSSYLRHLLRADNDFVFEQYLVYMFSYLTKMKRLIYQDKIFPRKVEMIKYLSIFIFESTKCKNILEEFMRNQGLVFKRIKTKSNKWTN
jgi:hypothetical protein